MPEISSGEKARAARAKGRKSAAASPNDIVTEQLRSYATRGVFREFSASALRGQRVEFRFTWLTSKPFHAVFDARTSILSFPALLPGVAARSPMRRALDEFLQARFSNKLPAHRRLSRSLIRELRCVTRNESVTISATLNARRLDEGVRQSVALLSELFQGFLAGPYHEYMVVNFDIRED